MAKYLFLLLTIVTFSSCATLFNTKVVSVRVHSQLDPAKVCINNDTTQWYTTPGWITVERAKEPLILTLKKDSVEKTVKVPSRLSTMFWLNLISSAGFAGMAIDLASEKRFTYPSYLTIDTGEIKNAPTFYYSAKKPIQRPEKKMLTFNFSIPEGNFFYTKKPTGYGSSSGFLGFTGGVEYYLSNKHSINVDGGIATNFIIFFPVPIDGYRREGVSTGFGAVQYGSDIGRLHYSLGLQYSNTFYNGPYENYAPGYVDSTKRYLQVDNAGFAFSSYYKVTKTFAVGLNYFPSLAAWGDEKLDFHYSHVIFLNLLFRFESNRSERNRY